MRRKRPRKHAKGERPRTGGAAPEQLAELLGAAMRSHQSGHLEQAEARYRQVLSLDRSHAGAWHHLGVLRAMRGRAPEAIGPLEKAARFAADNGEYMSDLGNAYLAAGRKAAAETAYRRAIERQPRLAGAHYNLANLLADRGDSKGAIEGYFTALECDPERPDVCVNLALVLEAHSRFEEAKRLLQRAARLAPQEYVVHSNLGDLLRRMDDLDGARAAFRRAIECAPEVATSHVHLAAVLQTADRLDEAEAALRRARELDPGLLEATISLSSVLQDQGRYAEAIELLDEIIAHDPAHQQALTDLALCYQKQGKPAQALETFARALGVGRDRLLFPAQRYCLAHYGITLQRVGRRDEARAIFDFERMVQVRRLPDPPGWPDLDAFHAALTAHIHQHPTLKRDRALKATVGGSQTGELLASEAPVVATLRAQIHAAIERYMREVLQGSERSFAVEVPPAWMLNGWAVVLDSGGYQSPHIHPAAYCSGVYYVRVPDAVAAGGEDNPGCLAFGRSQPHALGDESQTAFLHRILKPEPGLLVLFPSHFWHYTIPFTSDQERICVAFDAIAE